MIISSRKLFGIHLTPSFSPGKSSSSPFSALSSSLGTVPAYGGGPRLDTVQAGTFWGVLNVSLRASGTQLELDLTCFVIVIHHSSFVIR